MGCVVFVGKLVTSKNSGGKRGVCGVGEIVPDCHPNRVRGHAVIHHWFKQSD
jgi:hypothetical protein